MRSDFLFISKTLHIDADAQRINYPPLSELPEVPSIVQDTPIEFLWDIVEGAMQRLEGKLDDLADGVGDIWNYFFRESLEDTYGTYINSLEMVEKWI